MKDLRDFLSFFSSFFFFKKKDFLLHLHFCNFNLALYNLAFELAAISDVA